MVTVRYSNQQGSKSRQKPCQVQPIENIEKVSVGVKTMSLGTNYSSFYCLECCPTNKVIRSDTIRFLTVRGLHEDNLCDILQAMAPTNNVETVHQTSLSHIESNLDRLGLLSPTHGQRSQQQSGQITLQTVLIDKPKFF